MTRSKTATDEPRTRPPQHQPLPGLEVVTGGDSGIGRPAAIAVAKEGADVAIVYLDEHEDARRTQAEIERLDRHCVPIAADLTHDEECDRVVDEACHALGRLGNLGQPAAPGARRDLRRRSLPLSGVDACSESCSRSSTARLRRIERAAIPSLGTTTSYPRRCASAAVNQMQLVADTPVSTSRRTSSASSSSSSGVQ
jgi:NAD(P)-dependent dehydrogenase (short-subunit alcohol dehydrogenase family)